MKTDKKLLWTRMAAITGSLLLVSCHFGDIDDVRPKDYDNVVRDFKVSLDAVNPTSSSKTRTLITDLTVNGLDISWSAGDEIAMFCHDANIQTDDKMPAVRLTQPEDIESSDRENGTTPDDEVSWASFTAQVQLKAANSSRLEDNHTFSFVYPYSQVGHEMSNAQSIYLDFTGQDGSLQSLQSKYHYAWGIGAGTVTGDANNADMNFSDVMGDKCNDAKAHADHSAWEKGNVVLDNKMSIIRFSLVHQKSDGTLENFSQYKNITNIIFHEENGSLYNVAKLDVASGKVSGENQGSIYLGNDADRKPKLTEIYPTDDLSANGQSWGSTFYLSIPVPDNNAIYKCWLEVKCGNDTYFAYMKDCSFNEGRYYLTKPVVCTDKKSALLNPIEIMLDYEAEQGSNVYNESLLVWDAYGAPIVWDRYGLYYIPYYAFENLEPGCTMTIEFAITDATHGDFHIRDGKGYQGGSNLPITECLNYPNSIFGAPGSISITSMTNAGVINWQYGVSVSFTLTEKILQTIKANSHRGVGITFSGDGDYKQLLNRVVISGLSESEFPNPLDYGVWFKDGKDGQNGYISTERDMDDLLGHYITYLRNGDVIRIHYRNNTTSKVFIGPNRGDVFVTPNLSVYEFGTGKEEGDIYITVDDTFRYMAAYHDGLRFRVNYNGNGGALTIDEIEVVHPSDK